MGRTKEGKERNKTGGHAFKIRNVKTRCKRHQKEKEEAGKMKPCLITFCFCFVVWLMSPVEAARGEVKNAKTLKRIKTPILRL